MVCFHRNASEGAVRRHFDNIVKCPGKLSAVFSEHTDIKLLVIAGQ